MEADAVSTGAAWLVTTSVPVAVALSVNVPAVVNVLLQVRTQVSPGSRMPLELVSPLWRVAAPQRLPLTVTLLIECVPVFASVYVNVAGLPTRTGFGAALSVSVVLAVPALG